MSPRDLTPSHHAGMSNSNETRDDTHTDYQAAKRTAQAAMQRGVWQDRFERRFEPLSNRQMRCDLPREAMDAIAHGKHYASYRGLTMAKDPFDRVLYETLFFELQPRTVVELGAYTGASAMWMADVLKTFGIDGRVLTVDLDLELVEEAARRHPGVEFVEGDLNAIEEVLPAGLLAEMDGPVILIDDAHVNVAEVYEHFERHALRSGDYLIIEDTMPWIPATFGVSSADSGEGKSTEESAPDWGPWKWDEVLAFFQRCESDYVVDRYYTDFFGYNATWNWNGFLRKS